MKVTISSHQKSERELTGKSIKVIKRDSKPLNKKFELPTQEQLILESEAQSIY